MENDGHSARDIFGLTEVNLALSPKMSFKMRSAAALTSLSWQDLFLNRSLASSNRIFSVAGRNLAVGYQQMNLTNKGRPRKILCSSR